MTGLVWFLSATSVGGTGVLQYSARLSEQGQVDRFSRLAGGGTLDTLACSVCTLVCTYNLSWFRPSFAVPKASTY